MKLRFTCFRGIYPFGYFVQWTIDSLDPGESGPFKFSLYRSGAEGPWERLFEGQDQYSYFDKFNAIPSTLNELQPNGMRLFADPVYRIDCTLPSGKSLTASDQVKPQDPDRKMSQYLRKIQRDFRLSLKFNGTRVALLKKRRWGVRCLKCFDRRTKEVIRANCRECWGTGFIGGYWDPFITYGRSGISATGSASPITPMQRMDAASCTFWLPDHPSLEGDDIVIRLADQRRFRVDQQIETQIQLHPAHQEVNCEMIPDDNILYRLPVSPDVENPAY